MSPARATRKKARASPARATRAALADAHEEDFIYVGGSSFVVADLLSIKF